MKASAYVALLTLRYGVTFGIAGTRLLFVSDRPLPDGVRIALRQFSAAVLAYLATGLDDDLTANLSRRELDELGLLRMNNGCVTHPDGDDAALDILAGVVASEDARRDALARRIDSDGLPPRAEVHAKEVIPGTFVWTETKGARTVPMFNGRPLLQE